MSLEDGISPSNEEEPGGPGDFDLGGPEGRMKAKVYVSWGRLTVAEKGSLVDSALNLPDRIVKEEIRAKVQWILNAHEGLDEPVGVYVVELAKRLSRKEAVKDGKTVNQALDDAGIPELKQPGPPGPPVRLSQGVFYSKKRS